ncbi:putative reverse transcriptase domain-containing protein [Tanacetum coccineum]
METQANEDKLLKKLESEPVNTTLVNDIRKTPEYTCHLQELVSNKIQIEELSMIHAISKRNVKNVLVKIHKFVFPVDFVILDIVEDNKVLIILGRPMLDIAHARIDVFGGKISLEVVKEQVIFNANEGTTPVTVSPVCVIKDFDVINDIEGPDDLEEFLMDDDINGDLGNFL